MSQVKSKIGESSSGEVANGFWSCRDLTDVVPLYSPRGLYLKPIAKINVSVNLPQLKTPGKTISTWEVMEKIRALVQPDEFASLKVAKSTLEFIRLEGDLSDRCRLQRVLARLDSQRLNLAGFPNVLKVRVVEAKDDFPNRHSWDSYFRDAKHMNELKPGERPDTIHITGLPVKWFSEDSGNTPSESIVARVFEKWGPLRRCDVPAADVYRPRMRLGNNIQKFSFGDGIFFEAYIQYIEYMDFVKAMDALRGMKLLKKEPKNCLTAILKVDFDKTKHMSDSTVSHREFERKRLVAQDNLAAEKLRRKEEAEAQRKEEEKKKEAADMEVKAIRRKAREEKRKRKALRVFRKQEEDKVSMKIAREEQKLIKAQRQLESIRLLDELFDRIKSKVEKKELVIGAKNDSKVGDKKTDRGNDDDSRKSSEKDSDKRGNKKNKKLKKKKSKKEKKKKKKHRKDKDSGSGSSSDNSDTEGEKKKMKSVLTVNNIQSSSSAGAGQLEQSLNFQQMYPRFPQAWYYEAPVPMIYPPMGRGGSRGGPNRFQRGRGRGYAFRRGGRNNRGMGPFNPHIYNEQYYKYFANLAGQDYPDYESDYEGSLRSRSRSRGARRTRSKSRGRSRSRSKSRGQSRSRTRSRGRSRSRGRRRSRKGRRSSGSSRDSSRSNSRRRRSSSSRRRSRSSHRSRSRERSRSRAKSRSREIAKGRNKRRKRSRSKVMVTRARSRSISAKRRSASSSWSMPKSPRQRSCSWSKNESVNDSVNKPELEKTTNDKPNNTPKNVPPAAQTEVITPD